MKRLNFNYKEKYSNKYKQFRYFYETERNLIRNK